MIAAGQTWKTVWDWQGNNADGPIAGDGGTLLFANNDASNVMRMDPATGLATVVHRDVNTGRRRVAQQERRAVPRVARPEPRRACSSSPRARCWRTATTANRSDCVGGVLNDLSADSRGGVYVSISGAGVFYANPQGVISQYGDRACRAPTASS